MLEKHIWQWHNGRQCCQLGLKTYFLKATELNQRLTDARKYGRESSTINGLVKPSCLIIDEVGRCVFDKENNIIYKSHFLAYVMTCCNTNHLVSISKQFNFFLFLVLILFLVLVPFLLFPYYLRR